MEMLDDTHDLPPPPPMHYGSMVDPISPRAMSRGDPFDDYRSPSAARRGTSVPRYSNHDLGSINTQFDNFHMADEVVKPKKKKSMEEANVVRRRDSVSKQRSSSMELYRFEKIGDDWHVVDRARIHVPRSALENKVKKGEKTIIDDLRSMPPLRRKQIDQLVREKNKAEPDPTVEWHAAWLDAEKRDIPRGKKFVRECLAMDVIVARSPFEKKLSVSPPRNRQSFSGTKVDLRELVKRDSKSKDGKDKFRNKDKDKDKGSDKEDKKEKKEKREKNDDVFASEQPFDRHGHVVGPDGRPMFPRASTMPMMPGGFGGQGNFGGQGDFGALPPLGSMQGAMPGAFPQHGSGALAAGLPGDPAGGWPAGGFDSGRKSQPQIEMVGGGDQDFSDILRPRKGGKSRSKSKGRQAEVVDDEFQPVEGAGPRRKSSMKKRGSVKVVDDRQQEHPRRRTSKWAMGESSIDTIEDSDSVFFGSEDENSFTSQSTAEHHIKRRGSLKPSLSRRPSQRDTNRDTTYRTHTRNSSSRGGDLRYPDERRGHRDSYAEITPADSRRDSRRADHREHRRLNSYTTSRPRLIEGRTNDYSPPQSPSVPRNQLAHLIYPNELDERDRKREAETERYMQDQQLRERENKVRDLSLRDREEELRDREFRDREDELRQKEAELNRRAEDRRRSQYRGGDDWDIEQRAYDRRSQYGGSRAGDGYPERTGLRDIREDSYNRTRLGNRRDSYSGGRNYYN